MFSRHFFVADIRHVVTAEITKTATTTTATEATKKM